MIPFPGESLRVYDSWSSVTDDYDLSGDLIYRGPFGGADGHRVIDAGDQWRSWAYAGDFTYLEESGLDLACFWVVEVLSGTATLALRDFVDAGFDYDTGYTLPNSLGTLNVTGAGTYVLPASFTEADVTGSGALELSIDCVSGSCDVQQVKLRVWPASGALGAWSPTYPEWDESTAGVVWGGTTGVAAADYAEAADEAAAWAALQVALPDDVATYNGAQPSDVDLIPNSAGANASASMTTSLVALGVYSAQATGTVGVFMFARGGLDFLNPVSDIPLDYIVPPTEVTGDVPAIAQMDGDPTATWDSNPVTAYATYAAGTGAGSDAPGGGLAYVIETGPLPPSVSGGLFSTFTLDAPLTDGPFITPATDGVTVTGTLNPGAGSSAESVVVAFNYSGLVTLPDYPSGWTTPNAIVSPTATYDVGFDLSDGATYTIHHPAFRVWDPTAVLEAPLRLMQRGDGLGMGSGRVFGVGTRQGSIRVFGSV